MLWAISGDSGCVFSDARRGGAIDVQGMLYGTTSEGGTADGVDGGSVFALDPVTGNSCPRSAFMQT